MVSLLELLAITTFLDQKEPGMGDVKAPAAICRKVAYLPEEGGLLRCGEMGYRLDPSCLSVNVEATRHLMDSEFMGPVNIGSEEMVTINELVDTAARVSGKEVQRFTLMVLLV